MLRKSLLILFILSLSLPTHALELAEPQNRASEADENILLTEFKASEHLVNDLLLFYEYEDLLVEAPTRRPTKIRYVAENISVITAAEIEAMNAHSVNEILKTVNGMDVFFRGGHFGGSASLGIHASNYRHTLLLLDGVRLNDVDAGYPQTAGIPVQIIDRIEIIKGPASSAWGSSLGGVINIITKDTGKDLRPSGTLYGSYGEGKSQDYLADAAGRFGKTGYYLYGGYMDSDGLLDDRHFKNKSFYGKSTAELAKNISLTVTAGYWHPDMKDFDWPEIDYSYINEIESYLITGRIDAALSPDLKLNLNLHYYSQDWTNHSESLETGELIDDEFFDNSLWGSSASLVWEKERHTMLFGAEYDHGKNDRSYLYASAPSINWGPETRQNFALYFNDTIKLKKISVTPGLRYDHLSISGAGSDDIISPSLGATYRIAEDTLLRATASHGFIRRPIGMTVGSPGYAGYPALEPESIWSFQGGIESARFKSIHLKADVFYHRQDDTLYWNSDAGLYTNGGVSRRTGFELDAAANPFDNFTGSLGYTYIRVEPYNEDNNTIYSLNTKLRYSTEHTGSLTLFGRYAWLSSYHSSFNGKYDDMMWDLHYNKDVLAHNSATVNIFFSVRNLFNGSYYSDELLTDPDRWVEAGLRIKF